VSLTGEKLPVFLVLKGKRDARIHREVIGDFVSRGFPGGIVMTVQPNAWRIRSSCMSEVVDKLAEIGTEVSANVTS
jgi:hypothetical protein